MSGTSSLVIMNFDGLANTKRIEGANGFHYLHTVGVLLPSNNEQLC